MGAPDMYRFQLNTFQIGPFPNQLQSALSDAFVYLDTLSWTHGHHSVRFGVEVDRTSIRRNLPVLDNGLLYFSNRNAATPSISDFQNFLNGYTFLGEAGGGVANHDYHIPAYGGFIQDDWRVAPSLTLNLGIRTEWVGAAYDKLCHLGNAVLEDANPPISNPFVYPSCAKQYNFPTVTAAATLNSAALNNEYARVPEPRIGFAYDIGGKHQTVVRGGYGIYSVREDIGAVDNLSFTAPFFPLSGGPSTPVGSGGLGMGCLFNAAPTLDLPSGRIVSAPGARYYKRGLRSPALCFPGLWRRSYYRFTGVLGQHRRLVWSCRSSQLDCAHHAAVELDRPTSVGRKLDRRDRICGHQGQPSALHL